MRVRAAYQSEIIQLGESPVHSGIRAHSRLYRMYVLRLVLEALFDGIEARHAAEEREPWSPCVRRDYLYILVNAFHHLDKLRAREAEYRPAVVVYAAFFLQGSLDLLCHFKIFCQKDIMHSSSFAVLGID